MKRSQRYFAQASLAGTSFPVEPEVIRGILRQQVSAILTSNTQANGGSTSTIGKAKAVLALGTQEQKVLRIGFTV